MARVQYGAFITQLKGSIAGSTFQSSRHGFSVRNKPIAPKGRSTDQNTLRDYWRIVSQHWRTLPQADRDTWAAVAPSWPAVDAYGNSITLTGFECYMRSNYKKYIVKQKIADIGSLPVVLYNPVITDVVASIALGTIILTFANGPVDPDFSMIVEAAAPVSAGTSYRPSSMRGFAIIPTASVSPYDLTAAYVTKWGQFPPEGTRLCVDISVVSEINGTSSAPFTISTIVQP